MPHSFAALLFFVVSFAGLKTQSPGSAPANTDTKPTKSPSIAALISTGVERLLEGEEGGSWPYEGVYRTAGEIPIGYKVGGTAIVCSALLYAAEPGNARANEAIQRGAAFILDNLGDPLLEPSTENTYDVRIWGQSCALEFFSHAKLQRRALPRQKEIDAWMPKLIETIKTEEIEGGGWNYAHRSAASTFVTGPVAQTLLFARAAGQKVPEELLTRAAAFLVRCRLESGAFVYDERILKVSKGKAALEQIEKADRTARIPGAIGRSTVSEATLQLLSKGNVKHIESALQQFHTHWEELEKRRKKTGTHVGTYGIAPYYFYYAHRFAALGIELLPEASRETEREKLLQVLLKTRDEDGTWNDRVFARSRNYGTAMVILALLGPRGPIPPTGVPGKKAGAGK